MTIVSIVSLAVIAFGLYVAVKRFGSKGQLDAEKWRWFTNLDVQRFLLVGLLNTLKVAVVAMALALVLGALLALGRLAPQRPIRFAATVWIEFFRAMPVLLLILFIGLAFPVYGLRFGVFWFLVIALVAYNGSLLGEVFRAGINSLDKGQGEAAMALGMGWWQRMGLVLVPQAVRRMVPAVVSQLVTLLKDSSLGFVLPYEELVRRGRVLGEDFTLGQPALQALLEVAVLYIAVNYTLSRLARYLEQRQRRRRGTHAPVATGQLEMTMVDAQAKSAEG